MIGWVELKGSCFFSFFVLWTTLFVVSVKKILISHYHVIFRLLRRGKNGMKLIGNEMQSLLPLDLFIWEDFSIGALLVFYTLVE